jgi:ABC-2 type transport system permease protein
MSPTMHDLIRSEMRKQRSIRFPAIALTAAAAAGVLTAIALITSAGHDGNPPLARGSLTELVHAPYAIVAGAALLLGILGVAGEFRHQTITATLLAAPGRGRLLTAKVIVHAGLGALLAVVAAAVNLAVAIPWLSSRGVPLSGPVDVAGVLIGGVAAGAIYGAAGAGLGALIANQTAAVTVSLVWLLAVEGLVVSFTSSTAVQQWLPGGALSTVAQGGTGPHTGLQFWATTGCAVVYATTIIAGGAVRIAHRDIT